MKVHCLANQCPVINPRTFWYIDEENLFGSFFSVWKLNLTYVCK